VHAEASPSTDDLLTQLERLTYLEEKGTISSEQAEHQL